MTMIKNELTNTIITLRDDQEICPRCKGKGFNEKYDFMREDGPYECHICEGTGSVDWAQLPFVMGWEQEEIELEEEIEEDNWIDSYYEELETQGSFIIDDEYQYE